MPELMSGEYISDQEDQEGYFGYDDTHCIHGTFVGGWAGPDYMCYHCEMGTTVEELDRMRTEDRECQARYARVKAGLDNRMERWDHEGYNPPELLDSIVRLAVWLGRRDHWR